MTYNELINQGVNKNNITHKEEDGVQIFSIKITYFNNESEKLNKIYKASLDVLNIKKDQDEYRIIIDNSINITSKNITRYNFNECTFIQSVYFINCVFLEDISFKNCHFKADLSFNNSTFNDNIRFHRSTFHKDAIFLNTTFNKLVDFYWARFKSNQQFHLTDFLDRAIFSNATFEKQTQFLYNKVKSSTMISFENASFKGALDLSRANFKCQLHFWNVETNHTPDEYWLCSSDNINKKEVDDIVAYRRMRETFRIIKNEFKSSGNLINSLEFKKKEMFIYEKELKVDNNSKMNDQIIVFFNSISNDFGTKWGKGVLFTFAAALFFYLLFLWSISEYLVFSWDGTGKTIRHYFEFLNITIWKFKPFGIEDYGSPYVILFVGKIFIGYGYFQTIQAFRKYSK
ncbi:hypothetical protein D6T69_13275 [Tenacibaculum singaporense]|uniref:Pentapeptide repeat-containing protein n=1 Tax=Tenacibaculum singaporense TaxID=2358479 RepID=A0A3Q8RSD9_9FLAO|nr:pentapeptide repeat-containing protein [Tenacibaculum singaporense]AZJ36439.1 hypothetical protein D6T69_13275 [Tenacibaculum singaporense]